VPTTTTSGTTIESYGSTALVQTGSNYFMNPVAGGSGPELEYSGAPVTSGEFSGWNPIGAEATSTGYDVAWKNGSADQYDVWYTDKSGNYLSDLGIVSGSNSSLEALETTFQQDLNGDGVIGVATTIESYGSTALVQAGSNYFMNPVAGGSGTELEYSGTPVTSGEFGAWTPIGAEATSTGYEVAWKNGSADQYDVWYTDKSGNYVSELGIVTGSNPSLQSLEPSFHQDLNGDGIIGLPAQHQSLV
jgi:serralysin